jgi:hypothetical protein
MVNPLLLYMYPRFPQMLVDLWKAAAKFRTLGLETLPAR